MEELKDYSGPFVRDLKYEDFSKEALIKLLQVYCKELLTIDTYWQEQMRNRVSDEAALECLNQNWCRIGKYEMKWSMDAMNIQGNDVEAYVKANQLLPSFTQGVYEYDWDLKSKDHAILTVQYCPALASLEKRGLTDRITWMCHVQEYETMIAYMEAVNPKMRVKPLKQAPRKSPDEVACQWEFTMEE